MEAVNDHGTLPTEFNDKDITFKDRFSFLRLPVNCKRITLPDPEQTQRDYAFRHIAMDIARTSGIENIISHLFNVAASNAPNQESIFKACDARISTASKSLEAIREQSELHENGRCEILTCPACHRFFLDRPSAI